jgi:regulator of protease activity HflC (stomatin/prohibitin superfamily)
MSLVNVIRGLAGISWFLVFGVIIFYVSQKARGLSGGSPAGIGGVIVLALGLNFLSAGVVFVEPTDRGVVVSALAEGGVKADALEPGLGWIVPYVDRVVYYPVSRQTYTMSIAHNEGNLSGDDSVESRTSDGQVVFVDASVIYTVDPKKVVQVHVDWKGAYEEGFVRTISRGEIREAVSSFTIEQVYSSERLQLTSIITETLRTKFAEEGFVLVDFVLRNVAFSDEYSASVERKQIAEQEAQQSKLVVEQKLQEADQLRASSQGIADAQVIAAEAQALAVVIAASAEAEARLIQANAEAEALRLLGAAIAENPQILTLQYIEKLADNIKVMLLPSDNPFLLPLPADGLIQ